MKNTIILILLFSFTLSIVSAQEIKLVFNTNQVVPIFLYRLDNISTIPEQIESEISQSGGNTIVIKSSSPVFISGGYLGNLFYLAEPGDKVTVNKSTEGLTFAGKGQAKFQMVFEIQKLIDLIPAPSVKHHKVSSIEEYLAWYQYTKNQLDSVNSIAKIYRSKLSDFAYKTSLNEVSQEIILTRLGAFSGLMFKVYNGFNNQADSKKLIELFDTTILPGALPITKDDFSSNTVSAKAFFYSLSLLEFNRAEGFEIDKNEAISSKTVRHYFFSKPMYSGLAREKLLSFLITFGMIKHGGGLSSETMVAVQDYLSLPGFPAYRKWLNEEVVKASRLSKGKSAPLIELKDQKDQRVSLKNELGKVILLDFWFTGCTGCVSMSSTLKKVEKVFENNPNVIFVSISVDRNKTQWINSINKKIYTTGLGIQLYTEGLGDKHHIIKDYNVTSYPTLYLLGPTGVIINEPGTDPRSDEGKGLIELIEKTLASQFDGPYVHYEDNAILSSIVSLNHARKIVRRDTSMSDNKKSLKIQVQSDRYLKPFQVRLKNKLEIEPSEFSAPPKIFAISDVEGNFDAFRKLLQVGGVIDENFNWVFGNGHLVFNGDLFDRGEQVTECLWLIYALEEKAKNFGGYVHFILGNHETMNLQGDIRYVKQKYKDNAALIDSSVPELYGEKTEIGRWLRTKNIIEKIGNLLFCHGGISQEMNLLDVSISDINKLVRPLYHSRTNKYVDHRLNVIFSHEDGPLWYRGFYLNGKDKASEIQVDSTLEKFGIDHIITGHTIVADTVSMHYDGKVFNTDTHHAKGKSEALLIEGDKFYRVNDRGHRRLLWDDSKKKTPIPTTGNR